MTTANDPEEQGSLAPDSLDASANGPGDLGDSAYEQIVDLMMAAKRSGYSNVANAAMREAAEAILYDATTATLGVGLAGAPAADDAAKPGERAAKKKHKNKTSKMRLQIAHQTAGRVRMKIASAKGNPELLREIAETFGVIPGIDRVIVNPTTGSVVLHYDEDYASAFDERLGRTRGAASNGPPPSEFEQIAQRVSKEAEYLAGKSHAAKVVVDFFKMVDRGLRAATHNTIDLKIALALGVIGLTLFEIGVHAATPVWLTLTVFALNHFLELQETVIDHESARAPIEFKAA